MFQHVLSFRKARGMCFLFLSLCLLSGCNGGGSSSDSETSRLSGKVVDGYVSGAEVMVYKSKNLSAANRIGQGTTHEDGTFELTLNSGTVPFPLFIRTQGGTDTETGLPAPNMLFVGEDSAGQVNITPLTDMHYKLALQKGFGNNGLTQAEDAILGRLGYSIQNIFADPEQDQSVKEAVTKALASGTAVGTLSDGNYTLALTYLESTHVNSTNSTFADLQDFLAEHVIQAAVEVNGTRLTGTLPESDETVEGHIQGSTFILDIVAEDSTARLAGSIGLMGSIAGTFISYDNPVIDNSSLTNGMFAGTFVPEQGLQKEAVGEMAQNLYAGQRHLIFRDTLGDDHDMGYAQNLNIECSSGEPFEVNATDFTALLADGTTTNATFQDGTLLSLDDDRPTSLVFLHFKEDNSADNLFFIQPVGMRKAFYFVTDDDDNKVYAAGEAFMSSGEESLTPYLEEGAVYTGRIMAASPSLVGNNATRESALAFFSGEGIGILPKNINALKKAYTIDDNGYVDKIILSGGMLGLYNDGEDSWFYPHRILLEIQESGALQGNAIFASKDGSFEKHASAIVGMAVKEGVSPPSFSGRLDFLYRTLYMNPDAINAPSDVPFAFGTLDIHGSSAVLQYTDSEGESGRSELILDDEADGIKTGIYHMHGMVGPGAEAEYMDIFWPVGGTKAAILVSGSSEGTVTEVGEGFITY